MVSVSKVSGALKLNNGPSYALLAAILFGSSTPLSKTLLSDIHPILLACLFYLGSGLGTFLILCLQKTKLKPQLIALSELVPVLLGTTLLGGFLGPLFLMYGIKFSTASGAALLLNLEVALTSLIAGLFFKEKLSLKLILGLVLVFLGGITLSIPDQEATFQIKGSIFVALSCLAWAFDNNLTKKLSSQNPVLITAIKSIVAGSANLILYLLFNQSFPKPSVLIQSLGFGFIFYGLSLIFFIKSLSLLGAARTGAYFALAPFVGALISIVFLNDPLTWHFLIASALMTFGMYCFMIE